MNAIKSILKKLLIGMTAVGILAGLVWVVSPTLTALADSGATAQVTPTPPGSTPSTPTAKGAARLVVVFHLEKLASTRQETNLGRADRLTGQVQAVIDRLQGAGKDITALEQALSAFNASITTARGLHDQAGTLITNHPGFDANGKVSDATTARQTVKDIHDLLVQARQVIQPAFTNLKTVLQSYRKSNATPKNNN